MISEWERKTDANAHNSPLLFILPLSLSLDSFWCAHRTHVCMRKCIMWVRPLKRAKDHMRAFSQNSVTVLRVYDTTTRCYALFQSTLCLSRRCVHRRRKLCCCYSMIFLSRFCFSFRFSSDFCVLLFSLFFLLFFRIFYRHIHIYLCKNKRREFHLVSGLLKCCVLLFVLLLSARLVHFECCCFAPLAIEFHHRHCSRRRSVLVIVAWALAGSKSLFLSNDVDFVVERHSMASLILCCTHNSLFTNNDTEWACWTRCFTALAYSVTGIVTGVQLFSTFRLDFTWFSVVSWVWDKDSLLFRRLSCSTLSELWIFFGWLIPVGRRTIESIFN